jgi:hypothetical protein
MGSRRVDREGFSDSKGSLIMGHMKATSMSFGDAGMFKRSRVERTIQRPSQSPAQRPVPIPCDYCSRASLVMQSNCDGCGAGLPIPKPAVVYDSSVLDRDALMNVWRPEENIPVDLSGLSHNSKLSDYVYTFLSNQMNFISGISEFKR